MVALPRIRVAQMERFHQKSHSELHDDLETGDAEQRCQGNSHSSGSVSV